MNAANSGVHPRGTCLDGWPQVKQALAASFWRATSTKELRDKCREAAALSATTFNSASKRKVIGTMDLTHHFITLMVA